MPGTNEGKRNLPHDPGGRRSNEEHDARRVRFQDEARVAEYEMGQEERITTIERMASELRRCHDLIERGRQIVQQLFIELSHRKRKLQAQKGGKADRLCRVDHLMQEIDILSQALQLSHMQKEEYIRQLEELKASCCTGRHNVQSMLETSQERNTDIVEKMDAFKQICLEQETLIQKLNRDNERLWEALSNLQARMDEDRSLPNSPVRSVTRQDPKSQFTEVLPESECETSWSTDNEYRLGLPRYEEENFELPSTETSSLSKKLQKLLEQSENVQKLIATVGTKSQCELPEVSTEQSEHEKHVMESPVNSVDSESSRYDMECAQCLDNGIENKDAGERITVEDLLQRCREIEARIKRCSPGPLRNRFMHRCEMMEIPVKIKKECRKFKSKDKEFTKGERERSKVMLEDQHTQSLDRGGLINSTDIKTAQSEIAALREDLQTMLDNKCAMELSLRKDIRELKTLLCSKDVEIEAMRKQVQEAFTAAREEKDKKQYETKHHYTVAKNYRSKENDLDEIMDREMFIRLKEECKRLKFALERKTNEVDELREEMKRAIDNIEDLRSQLASGANDRNIMQLEEENKILRKENEHLKKLENEGIEEELASLQKAIEDAEVKLRRTRKEKEELNKKLQEGETNISEANKENERVHLENQELLEKLANLTANLDQDSTSSISELQELLRHRNKLIDDMTAEFEVKESTYLESGRQKDDQIHILKETLKLREETCHTLKEAIEQNEEEIHELNEVVKSYQNKLLSDNEGFKKTLETLCQNSVENIRDLKKENDNLKERLSLQISDQKEPFSFSGDKEGRESDETFKLPPELKNTLTALLDSLEQKRLQQILDWVQREGIYLDQKNQPTNRSGESLSSINQGESKTLEAVGDFLQGKDSVCLQKLLRSFRDQGVTLDKEGNLFDNSGKKLCILSDMEGKLRRELKQYVTMIGTDNAIRVLRWLQTEGVHFNERDQLVDQQERIVQTATLLGHQFSCIVPLLLESGQQEKNVINLMNWIVQNKPTVNDSLELFDSEGNQLFYMSGESARVIDECCKKTSESEKKDLLDSIKSTLERKIKFLPDGNFVDKFGIVYKHSSEDERASVSNLQDEIEALKNKISSIETSKPDSLNREGQEDVEEKAFIKELENDKLRKEIDECYSKLQEYENELAAITSDLHQLAESRDRVIETSKREKAELHEKMRADERRFKASNESMSGLIEKLNVEKRSLEDELTKAKEVISKLKSRSKELQEEINVEADKQVAIMEERDRWNDLKKTFEQEIERLGDELTAKEDIIEELSRGRSASRTKIISESATLDETELEAKQDKNIEIKKLQVENQLLRSRFVSLEEETTATTKVVADMERGHGHLTGALRCHLVFQKPATAKLLENSLQTYHNEHEDLKKKFEMVETKYDREGNYSSRRDFARELFENARATIANIQNILDQGVIKVEDDLEKDFNTDEDFEATDYKARLWILRRRLSDVERRHRELQLKAEELSIRLDAKTAEFEVTQDELEDATRDLETNEHSMTKLRGELDNCLRENLQLKDILAQLRDQHTFAVETVLTENEDLRRRVIHHTEDKENRMEGLQSELEDLRRIVAKKESDFVDLAVENSQRKVEMEKLRSRLKELESQLNKRETQNELLQKQIESMRAGARYHHHYGTIHMLRDDLKKLWSENTSLKEENLKKQKIINEMSRELRNARSETREQRNLGEKLEKRLMESGSVAEPSSQMTAELERLKIRLKGSEMERYKIEEEKYKLELKFERESAEAKAKISELVLINEALLGQINRARERESRAKGEFPSNEGSTARIQQSGSGDSLDVFQGKPSNGQKLNKSSFQKTVNPTTRSTKDHAEGPAIEASESTDSFDIFNSKTSRPAKNLLEESSDSLVIYSGSDRNISNTMDLEREQAKNIELVSELDEARRELQSLKEENRKLLDRFAEKENKLKESLLNSISESEKIVLEQGENMKKINDENTRLLVNLRGLEEENKRLRDSVATEEETYHEQDNLRCRVMELETQLLEKEAKLQAAEVRINRTGGEFQMLGREGEREQSFFSQDPYSVETLQGKSIKSPSHEEECILPVDEAASMAEKFDFPFPSRDESRDPIASKISRPRRGETPSPVRGYVSRIPVPTSPKPRRHSIESTEYSLGSAGQEPLKEDEMRAAIETVDQLTKEVFDLKQELKEARAAKARLPLVESENVRFKAEIDRLQLEIKDFKHKAMKINNEKSEINRLRQEVKELREMRQTATEISRENEALKEELEKSKEHIKDLIKKLAKHSNGKSELMKVKQELKEANEARQKVGDLQRLYTSAQEEMIKLNKRIADLTLKLSRKSSDKESQSPRVPMSTSQAEEELLYLRRELTERDSEIEVLKKELSEVRSLLFQTKHDDFDFTDLKSEHTQSSDDNVANLKETESSGDDEPLVLLKEKLESVSLEMENANIRSSQLEAENQALRVELTGLKANLRTSTENVLLVDDASGSYDSIRREIPEGSRVIQTSKEVQNIRDINIVRLESANEGVEVDIKNPERLQEEISVLTREAQLQSLKLSYLEEECSNLTIENKSLSQQVAELTEAADKFRKRIMETEEIFTSMQKEKEEMEAELALAMEEKRKAYEALQEANNKFENFKTHSFNPVTGVKELDSELTDKNDKVEDTEQKWLDLSETEISSAKTHQVNIETYEMEVAALTRKVQDLEMEVSELTLHLGKEKEFSQILNQEKMVLNRNLKQSKKKRDDLKRSFDLIKNQTTTTVTTIVEEFEEILEGDPRVPILEEKLKQKEHEILKMKLALEAVVDDNTDEEDITDDDEEKNFTPVSGADESSHQNVIQRLEKELRWLEEASSSTEVYLKESRQQVKTLEAEREDLLNKLISYEEMLGGMQAGKSGKEEGAHESVILYTEMEHIKATLSAVEKERDELRAQLKERGVESERLAKEVESRMADNLLRRVSQEDTLTSPRDSNSSLESESSLRDSEREYITASTKKLKKRLLGAYRDLKDKSVELATLRMNLECRSIEMHYDRDVQAVEDDVQGEIKAFDSDQNICTKIEYNALIAKIAALEREAKERELELLTAEEEIKILKPQAAAMQEERGMRNREEQELDKVISVQREKIENLLAQNEKKGKKIKDLQESLQERTQAVRHLRSELDRIEEKYRHEVMQRQGWMQEKEELTGYKDKRIKELERQMMAAEAKVDALESANKEYHVEQEKLREEMLILQNQLEERKEQQRESDLHAAEEKNEQLVALRKQTEIQKQQYELEIRSLKSSLADLKSKQVGSLREDNDNILAERMELQSTISQLEEDLTGKENILEEMYTKNRLLEIELSTAKTRIADLIDELADLDEEKRRLTGAS